MRFCARLVVPLVGGRTLSAIDPQVRLVIEPELDISGVLLSAGRRIRKFGDFRNHTAAIFVADEWTTRSTALSGHAAVQQTSAHAP